MARPPKGKPLALRAIRLDDDVWAECKRLGEEHGTINEGLSVAQTALQLIRDLAHRDPGFRDAVIKQLDDREFGYGCYGGWLVADLDKRIKGVAEIKQEG